MLLAWLILLTPQFARALTRVLRALGAATAGVRGTLALANARRDPRRAAATAGALTVCVTRVGAVTVALASVGATAGRQAAADVPGDFRIS